MYACMNVRVVNLLNKSFAKIFEAEPFVDQNRKGHEMSPKSNHLQLVKLLVGTFSKYVIASSS